MFGVSFHHVAALWIGLLLLVDDVTTKSIARNHVLRGGQWTPVHTRFQVIYVSYRSESGIRIYANGFSEAINGLWSVNFSRRQLMANENLSKSRETCPPLMLTMLFQVGGWETYIGTGREITRAHYDAWQLQPSKGSATLAGSEQVPEHYARAGNDRVSRSKHSVKRD